MHLQDLATPEAMYPDIFAPFIKGNVIVTFVAIVINQTHEQNNATLKDEGAVCLTENDTASQRWMVSDPGMIRMIVEFEAAVAKSDEKTDWHAAFIFGVNRVSL